MANRPGPNNPTDQTSDNPADALHPFFNMNEGVLKTLGRSDEIISESLVDQITSLINGHSLENGSNTPDFILTKFLMGALILWNRTTNERDAWFRNRSRVDGPWPTDVLELTHKPDSIGARMYGPFKGPFEITLDFNNPAKGREVLEALARTYPDAFPTGVTIQDIAQRRYPEHKKDDPEDTGMEA